MPEGEKSVEVPFELYSNLIAIPVTINGYVTLKFILDSGSESAILTEKLFGDLLDLDYVRTMHVSGPGTEDSINAFVASNIYLSLPGGIKAKGMNMLVLEKDYLQLKKNLGDEIYGIIGHDVFSRFVVEINYDDLKITFHDPSAFKPRRSYTRMPLEVDESKPYTYSVITQDGHSDSVKLLIDTGASHAVLLDVKNTEDITIPKKTIDVRLGRGLGGEIPGRIGRMNYFILDEFCFENILASIPSEGAYMKAIKRGSRHGTLGGEVLRRFRVVMDYRHESLYLKKGRHFKEKFDFDMSGLTLSAEGDEFDTLLVKRIRENTPADDVDIQVGDIILRINGTSFLDTDISDIHNLFRKKDGKKIRLIIYRDGEKIKRIFRLKQMI